jgi:leucyl-tRNA synthetase
MCDRAEQAARASEDNEKYEQPPYDGEGVLINSGEYNGQNTAEGRERIVTDFAKQGLAKEETNYRLRDWLISRQRYWGPPIPVIYCDECGIQPVSENDLPVLLPEDVEFTPTGQSPLLLDENFVNTKCPSCDGPAKRETDTMDTFVDSSWYFLRYPDPGYKQGPYNPEIVKSWGPVDHYIGGIEHAILHLMYARFVTMFLHDHHGLPFEEPFKKLSNQGIILGPDGHKMSKSRGNVVSPDEQVTSYGADSLRLYMMFMGPYDQGGPYNLGGIVGTRRFLERVWSLIGEFTEPQPSSPAEKLDTELTSAVHRTIKSVSQDLEQLAFNTAIASLMGLVNELYRLKADHGLAKVPAWQTALDNLVLMLAPFAPHISEELWQDLGHESSVHNVKWPLWDELLIKQETVTLAIQINGKVRAEIEVPADISEAKAIELAKTSDKVISHLDGKELKKAIYVPGRLVSLVI